MFVCLCAGNGKSVHVLAGRLNGDLLNDGLELGGGNLNLLDLGLNCLVGDSGVGVGQGVVDGVGEWESVVSVGVVVGKELGCWCSSRCGLSGGSLSRGGLSGCSLSGCSLSLSGCGLSLSGCLGSNRLLFLGRPPLPGAWHTDSKAVLAAGFDKLSLVGLDLNLVLLGDELLDDGLVVVDQGCGVGNGLSVGETGGVDAGESVWEDCGDLGGLLGLLLLFLGGNNCQSDNKDQLNRKMKEKKHSILVMYNIICSNNNCSMLNKSLFRNYVIVKLSC